MTLEASEGIAVRPESRIALVLPAEGSVNLGNDMICQATRRIIKRLPPQLRAEEFTFLRTPDRHEVERINKCDRAVFVGTNIFQSEAVGWKWRAQDLEQISIPYSLFGVGYSGPLGRPLLQVCRETRDLIKWSRKANAIGVRDLETVRWLRLFGLNSELVGCPVLAYPNSFTEVSSGNGPPLLAVRAKLLHTPHPESEPAQQELEDWFFREHPDGLGVAQDASDSKLLEDKPHIDSLSEIVSKLSSARFVISTRLHAGMLALAFGRPTVFMAHDTRVESFCQLVGIQSHSLTREGVRTTLQAVQRIERGDLSEFSVAVQRLPELVRRLHSFLRDEIEGTRVKRLRHPRAITTTLLRAKARFLGLAVG